MRLGISANKTKLSEWVFQAAQTPPADPIEQSAQVEISSESSDARSPFEVEIAKEIATVFDPQIYMTHSDDLT